MKNLLIIFVLLSTMVCGLWTSAATAEIPRTINYQGKLTDKQGYALTGAYNVTFRLYDAATAGNLLWTEQHANLQVQKGLFSVLLGSTEPLNLTFDKQYYLAIQVGGDPEMAPRQSLASAPYAYSAMNGAPTGSLVIWTTDIPPPGWLLCDGSAISRITYSVLFNVIGTTYGAGDESTTFNVPDLRGRIPLGQDDMGGSSADRVTDTLADSLSGALGAENKTTSRYAGNQPQGGNPQDLCGEHSHTVNILQPSLTLNYIIKT